MIKANLLNTLKRLPNLLILSKFFQYFSIFAIVFSLAWSTPAWAAVPHVEVVALFEGKAMLLIDKKQILMSAGETTEQGITLLSADARGALIRIGDRTRRYTLGGLIHPLKSADSGNEEKIYVYRGPDNLFRTTGSINGYPVNFLVDTGASSIAFSSEQAKRLGINYRLDGSPTLISTASGTENGFNVTIDRITISGITLRSIGALVIEGVEPKTPLLGMSYLNRFEIINQGRVMMLKRKY